LQSCNGFVQVSLRAKFVSTGSGQRGLTFEHQNDCRFSRVELSLFALILLFILIGKVSSSNLVDVASYPPPCVRRAQESALPAAVVAVEFAPWQTVWALRAAAVFNLGFHCVLKF
jgi:hypothetical protein